MSTAQRGDEESARHTRRSALKALNVSNLANGTVFCCPVPSPHVSYPAGHGATGLILVASTGSSKPLDSSLKRYSAFIKKVRQSVGAENRDQLLKDIETLSLEKYVDELDAAALEGISRCKSEKDVWSAVEVHFCRSIILCHSPHAEDVGFYFLGNQRDSSSFPKDFYAKNWGFVSCSPGCAVPRFSRRSSPRTAREGGHRQSRQAASGASCVLGVGSCWNYHGVTR